MKTALTVWYYCHLMTVWYYCHLLNDRPWVHRQFKQLTIELWMEIQIQFTHLLGHLILKLCRKLYHQYFPITCITERSKASVMTNFSHHPLSSGHEKAEAHSREGHLVGRCHLVCQCPSQSLKHSKGAHDKFPLKVNIPNSTSPIQTLSETLNT